jgi:hypothetical protein
MKDAVAAELTLHANGELAHAVLLTTRIIQLGETPVLSPKGRVERGEAAIPRRSRSAQPAVGLWIAVARAWRLTCAKRNRRQSI